MNLVRAQARGSWWRRLKARFARKPLQMCSQCGAPLDNGQRLPRDVRVVCCGTVVIHGDQQGCIRLERAWG